MMMVQTFLLHDGCNLNELIKNMSFGDFCSSVLSLLEPADTFGGTCWDTWITTAHIVAILQKNERSQ